MGNLKWIAIALVVLVALYLLTRQRQSGLQTQADAVFPEDVAAIGAIEIWNRADTLRLDREGDTWAIAGHDTLQMRPNRMDAFRDKALQVKKETLVSKNPEKWSVFSVDDSTGTHVRLLDASGEEMVHAVFGRSQTDWSHNYVRVEGDEQVYLTDTSVMHMIYPRATYWGEKPVVEDADPDTSETEMTPMGIEVVDSTEAGGGDM